MTNNSLMFYENFAKKIEEISQEIDSYLAAREIEKKELIDVICKNDRMKIAQNSIKDEKGNVNIKQEQFYNPNVMISNNNNNNNFQNQNQLMNQNPIQNYNNLPNQNMYNQPYNMNQNNIQFNQNYPQNQPNQNFQYSYQYNIQNQNNNQNNNQNYNQNQQLRYSEIFKK